MKILSKSPLMEAVCEIIFMPSQVFDTTLPGVLYSEIKDEFPNKKENPGNMIAVPNLINEQAIDFTQVPVSQFFSIDNTQAVQIGKDLLVNNMLKPYKGWDIFKAQILRVVEIYSKNFNEKPKIRKATLRYVNVFVFDAQSDYLNNFSFTLPNPSPPQYKNNRAFNTLVEYDTQHGNILSLGFKSIYPPDNTKKSVSLEIQNIQITQSALDLESFEKWLNHAHNNIEDLFLECFKKQFLHSMK